MDKEKKLTMAERVYRRLPENYRETDGVNKKLHEIVYSMLEEIEDIANVIMKFRDIDEADSHTLDLIGSNVKEHRMGKNDETYRKWIKTRIIANLSRGDFNTLNRVASVILGDSYMYSEEAWMTSRYDNEPAAIIINMLNHIPYYDLDRLQDVLAAGVSYKYNLIFKQGTNAWLGMATQGGEDTTIYPYTIRDIKNKIGLHTGIGLIQSETVTIYPYKEREKEYISDYTWDDLAGLTWDEISLMRWG